MAHPWLLLVILSKAKDPESARSPKPFALSSLNRTAVIPQQSGGSASPHPPKICHFDRSEALGRSLLFYCERTTTVHPWFLLVILSKAKDPKSAR
jgi:hypothetical protein